MAVDMVRGLAILAVLAFHLGLMGFFFDLPPQPQFFKNLWFKTWSNGNYGVQVFFVVSGFLITRLIALHNGGLFAPDLRDFYIRRAGRILPLYLLVIGVGVAFAVQAGRVPPPLFLASLGTFTFNWHRVFQPLLEPYPGMHWGVLWSLSIEEQFYLLYPLALMALGRRRNLVIFLLGFIFLGPWWRSIGLRHLREFPDWGLGSFASFDLIAMGCLLFLVWERFESTFAKRPGLCRGIALMGITLFIWTYLQTRVKARFELGTFGPSGIGMGTALFLLGGLNLRIFRSRAWTFLAFPGKLSYGLYLLHIPLIYLLLPRVGSWNQWLAYLVLAGLGIPTAWLCYRLFEAPLNRRIRDKMTRSVRPIPKV